MHKTGMKKNGKMKVGIYWWAELNKHDNKYTKNEWGLLRKQKTLVEIEEKHRHYDVDITSTDRSSQ